jgi:small subunit ribosomal protein S7
MPRRRVVQKRPVPPDAIHKDIVVSKFISYVMTQGKKSVAEGIIYGAFELMKSRGVEDPLETFHRAVDNVSPRVEVKSRRVGGSTYQVPVEVASNRRLALALGWLRDYARQRGGRSMTEKLAAELMDAAAGRGGSVRKRDDVHRMAEANKAFSHYRW